MTGLDRPGLGQVAIVRGDARRLPPPDASVDLIVTSPPYWALRSYTDGGEHYSGQIGAEPTPAAYVDALIECTREWMRVLKPTGSLWINIGDKYDSSSKGGPSSSPLLHAGPEKLIDKRGARRPILTRPKTLFGLPWRYALRCIDDLGLILRAEVIWSKPNGLPESVTDRVRRSHEQWFHLVKQPRYYSAVDEIREEYAGEFLSSGARNPRYGRPNGDMPFAQRGEFNKSNPHRKDGASFAGNRSLGKLPGSVWTIPTQPLTVPDHLGVDHFAAFPLEWPRRIIAGWSPPRGLIVDPFGGTGTTALAARALGRNAISVDMSADYCRLASWRCSDPGELARAMGVPKPPPVPENQPDLFGGAA